MSMLQRCVSRPPVRPRAEAAGDDRLVAAWDAQASDMARIMAFRVEAGLLHEPAPGFWKGIAQAIGHRIGLPEHAASGADLLVP